MNSVEYWKKRALEAKRLTAQEAEKTAAYVEHQYRLAMKDIDDRINLWYKRFAQDNGMTMIEAKKALNSQELKSFRMDVKRYIREGKAMNGRMDPSWMKRLRNAAAVHHIERFEAIKIQTQQAMEVLYGNQLDAIDELTKRTYENGYYHSLYSIQTKTGLGWTVNAIDKKKLATIINKPWAPDGESFSSRIWKNRAVAVNELHAALTQSCITGAPVERVAQQMADRLRVRASDAARLIRTESAHFAATGDRQAYKDTGVEQYQWIAGLDHTTCTLCQELDAHVFDLNEAEEGMTLPPRHPNCRCTTVPYFDDEFTVDETRAARDEKGKTKQIPADMTYDAWEREFAPADYQRKSVSNMDMEAYEEWLDGYKEHGLDFEEWKKVKPYADNLLEKAKKEEPRVTSTLKEAVSNAGAHLEGLDYRIKGKSSLIRKLATKSKAKGLIVAQYSSAVTDVLRYTSASETKDFTKSYSQIIAALSRKGYNMIEVTNTLKDVSASYRGINTLVQNARGYVFELQFHTKESLEVKEKNHKLYEEQRLASTSKLRKLELDKTMRKNAQMIPTPAGIEKIGDIKNKNDKV